VQLDNIYILLIRINEILLITETMGTVIDAYRLSEVPVVIKKTGIEVSINFKKPSHSDDEGSWRIIMARMYSRRKGKSRSTRPIKSEIPEWIDINTEEIEQKVAELYEQGYTKAEIGLRLRDWYGVPYSKLVTGKKISQMLAEKGLEAKVPEDLENLILQAINLRKHILRNKKDLHNKRSLHLAESKVRRLVKYYKRKNKLPKDWKYTPAAAEMLISK